MAFLEHRKLAPGSEMLLPSSSAVSNAASSDDAERNGERKLGHAGAGSKTQGTNVVDLFLSPYLLAETYLPVLIGLLRCANLPWMVAHCVLSLSSQFQGTQA